MNYLLDKEGLQQVVAGLKAYVDERGGEAASIDIADIDFKDKIAAFLEGTLPTRMKVVQTTNGKTYSVGQLEMFSDNMGHQVTQLFVTNLILNSSGKFDGSHNDGKMYHYYRFYNHAMPSTTTGITKGTWSEWMPFVDDQTLDLAVKVGNMTNENKELVSPTISGTFTVKTSGGSQSSTSTNNSLDVENGFMVDWTGTFSWKAASGMKRPESVSGNWTTLPASGVVLAKGNDTKTATAKVRFLHRRYWGLTTEKTVTAAVVKALSGTDLNNTKTAKLTGISATDAQYFVIAYPKAMGDLSKIVQNGATPLLDGGFVKSEVNVTNAAGVAIAYYVYKTDKPGALKNNSFLEIA